MAEEGKVSSRFHSENNESNTRVCSMNSNGGMLGVNQKSANKIANYLSALNEIKGLVKEYQHKKSPSMLNFTNMTNISEYSYTDAISSKEENVICYINNPIEKNIYIENNNVKKRRIFPKNYLASINLPYRMDEIIFRPGLEQIIENEEENVNENKQVDEEGAMHEIPFISVKKQYDKILPKTSNKYSTSRTGYESVHYSHCPEVKQFDIENGGINKDLLPFCRNITDLVQDLDEEKELDLCDYYKKSSLKVKDTVNTITSAVSVNISDLNIKSSPDSKNLIPIKFRNINNKMQNNNSKILIVDSVLNNSQLHSSCNMSAEMKSNNTCTSYKKIIRNLKQKKQKQNTKKVKKKVICKNNNKKFLCDEFYEDGGHMQICNEKICISNKNCNENNYTLHKNKTSSKKDKHICLKYFKSEIFDSQNKKRFSSNKRNSNSREKTKTMSDLLLEKISLSNNKQDDMLIEEEVVNKNLLEKFNSCEESSSIQFHKENEFEGEMINLVTDNEEECNEGTESIGSSTAIEKGYITPVKNVRKTNRITDLIFQRNHSSHSLSLSSSKCNISYQNPNDNSLIHTIFDLEFITNLLDREENYKFNPDYISNHKGLMWGFRATLVDWLMEICEEFGFKRDTFYYTINYIDRFLSRTKNVNKKFLQLLGIASLSIAAKLEEVQIPKAKEYLIAMNNSYTEEEFCATEKHVLQILKWEIIPTTINTWLNWYLCQWDLFIETIDGIKEKILSHLEEQKQDNNDRSNEACEKEIIFFKKPDDSSYFHYRQIAQMIDLYTVDSNSLKLSPRYLVAASMFLVLCTNHGINQFRKENKNKFDFDLIFFRDLIHSEMWLVEIFKEFLKLSFNISIEDPHLSECFVYCGRCLDLEFQYDLPFILQQNHEVETETVK